MNTLTAYRPFSFTEFFAKKARALADRMDGGNIARPTPDDIRREQFRTASIALMEAEQEAERYTHTVAMLRKRVGRLQG